MNGVFKEVAIFPVFISQIWLILVYCYTFTLACNGEDI